MKKPLITVIIPSYNSGEFLPFTLESIIRQEYDDYEVIIVDGGSDDTTDSVVKKYSSIVKTYISEKDDGQADAVNKGLRYSEGDFVVWQNADDVFFPGAFSEFNRAYSSFSGYDVYFGDIALMSADGELLWTRYFTDVDRLIANYHGLICNNQSAFVRRDAIEQHGFLDKSYHYAMDREFFLRLYRKGARFKHFDCVVSGFRHQPKSKTETPENQQKWALEHRRITEQYGLFPPKSRLSVMLEKLGTVDKACRMLARNPSRFAAAMRRALSGDGEKAY